MIFFRRKRARALTDAPIELPGLYEEVAVLENLAGGIDQNFVAITTAVMAYQGRAQELCSLSGRVLNRLSSNELSESVAEISRIVSSLETSQSHFSSVFLARSRQLEDVLEKLRGIEAGITETESMLKTLDLLGFMTRVEDARLSGAGSEFDSLADEVRGLSHQIALNQHQIAGQVHGVALKLRASLISLKQLEENRSRQTEAIQQTARAALDELEQHYGATRQALDGLATAASGLEGDFASIVIELQLNDIARQKLEHVCAALNEAASEPQQFGAVVDLQCLQLERTAAELDTAIGASLNASRSIAGRGEAIVDELNLLVRADRGDNRISLSIARIERLIDALHASDAIKSEMDRTLEELWLAIDSIAQHVDEIKTIGFKMQLIALNSRIKAARLGNGGRVLESISGAIYGISLAARDQTAALAVRIAELKLDHDSEVEPEAAADYRLEDTTARLMGIETEMGATLEAIQRNTDGFAQGFGQIRALLEAAAAMPGEISAQVESLKLKTAGCERSNTGGDFAALAERYTMQSERLVHCQTEPAAIDDDLGLNVELF